MFQIARPIFLAGLAATPNIQAGFYAAIEFARPPRRVVLRCTGATFYRAFVNGRIVSRGPARAAHGMARVDEVDLTDHARPGTNHLAIEVAGYHLECHSVTGDASFVQAEVSADGAVVAATGPDTLGVHLVHRKPAERFSHARCAGEVYRLDAAYAAWTCGAFGNSAAHSVAVVPGPRRLLPRGVPLPDGRVHRDSRMIGVHGLTVDAGVVVRPIAPLEHGDYLNFIAALPERPAAECAQERTVPFEAECHVREGSVALHALTTSAAVDFDFGELKAGFLRVDLETPAAATVDLVFVDHLEADGTIYSRTGDMNGVIRLHVPGGRVRFEAFEPHCLRYVRVIARVTEALTIHSISVVDHAYAVKQTGTFLCSDGDLNRIYDAARLTLRLNTLDVFMDCPGRERAGWLCDALFSGRAMQTLFGDPSVERAMLENFLHAPESAESPGFFSECYPGRAITGGNFIPNWSMFLAIELAEHIRRTGDSAFADAYRERIERLMDGLAAAENAHGLLEHLPGFWFLDWSAANQDDFKRPISTATNALYAATLEAVAGSYARVDWQQRAAQVRDTLRRHMPADAPMSDALRPAGDGLEGGANASEAAQYYHFWTGVADAGGNQRGAWERLLHEHGPAPNRSPAGRALPPSNVFIGLYLRLELLARFGAHDQLLREMRALFLPMLARGPGTLWEHLRPDGSVCHGFASHAAVWLVRDILGIGLPDAITRTITIAPEPAGLTWARGTTLIDGHPVTIDWRATKDRFILNVSIPPGYGGVLRLPAALRTWRNMHGTLYPGMRFSGTLAVDLRPD